MAQLAEEQKGASEEEEEAPTLWTELEQAIAKESTPEVDLWATVQQRSDASLKEPKRAAGIEVAALETSKGEPYYVLNNPEADTYCKVDARDYFLWDLMDGEHTVRDLAVAYFAQYGAFPFERLAHLLTQLQGHQLLAGKQENLYGSLAERTAAHTLAHRLQRFAGRATQREFDLKNADGFYERLYRWGGWLLFTRPAIVAYALVIVAGLVLFVWELETGTRSLFTTAGSLGLGLIVLMAINYGMTFFHESGHALTCKHYGRRVPKGGFMLYMGSPAFFVDTTDIWMAPKRARIMVSLAGPFTTLLLGSLLAVVAGLFPSFAFSGVLFKAALLGYVSALMNMNPLLELDGYFVLTDWLEIPGLRRKSMAFVRAELPARLFKDWGTFSREQRIFAIFGVLAAVWTAFALVMAAYMWDREISKIWQDFVSGRDVLSVILVGGLMLLAGANLILGLSIKALLLAGEGARRVRRFLRTHSSREA